MILERLISLFAYTMIAQLTFSCIALADLPLTKLAFYKGEYNEVLKLTQETETTDADFAALQALSSVYR